jgi:hypothetical protein
MKSLRCRCRCDRGQLTLAVAGKPKPAHESNAAQPSDSAHSRSNQPHISLLPGLAPHTPAMTVMAWPAWTALGEKLMFQRLTQLLLLSAQYRFPAASLVRPWGCAPAGLLPKAAVGTTSLMYKVLQAADTDRQHQGRGAVSLLTAAYAMHAAALGCNLLLASILATAVNSCTMQSQQQRLNTTQPAFTELDRACLYCG